ncbi:hypothetical protein [Catenulispora pinisilvae]|uniref:hypothetical protein n=1 Tax=Catenulispora pinisilvae TaxID=2705253 RepID=UPI001890CEB8|nr:hypothetical protein [Catenulispora pinisilvae]
MSQIQALADAVPVDLVALELKRRRVKAHTRPDGCGYRLYLAEKAIRNHEWMAARRQDWRTARKALRYAADRVEQLRSRRSSASYTDGPDF